MDQKIISLPEAQTRHRHEQHLWLALCYLHAFEENNHDILSAILELATHDQDLEQLIQEVNEELINQYEYDLARRST